MSNSDWNRLRDALEEFGCTEKMSGGGSHIKIFYKDHLITALPGSPSSVHAMANKLAELRRRLPGFEYRTKQPRKRREQNEEDE